MENIENILESIMFIAGEGIDMKEFQEKFELSESELKTAVESLKTKYSEPSGISVILYKNKIQFSSNPEYSALIEDFLNPIKEKKLSKATLETMAIIAYKQPVTRLEIEEIRGVGSDYAIDILLKNSLIEVVGRKDAIGKPLLYGTTEDFLKRFELLSLDYLPKYEEILDKIKTIKEEKAPEALYNEFEILNELEKEVDITLEETEVV